MQTGGDGDDFQVVGGQEDVENAGLTSPRVGMRDRSALSQKWIQAERTESGGTGPPQTGIMYVGIFLVTDSLRYIS